jgi:ribose transport system permease protein
MGGSGHYAGTVAGAMVLTVLSGLLPALGLSTGALMIVYGGVILVTVSIGSDALGSAWRVVFPPRDDKGLGKPS